MNSEQQSGFNLMCHFYGTKLLLTRLAQFEHAIGFVRWASDISPADAVQSGIRVYQPLWMDLLAARSGKKLPFNHDLGYFKFWGELFPKGKRYYSFKREGEKAGSLRDWKVPE